MFCTQKEHLNSRLGDLLTATQLRDALIECKLTGVHHVLRIDRGQQPKKIGTLPGVSRFQYFEVDSDKNTVRCFLTRGVGKGILLSSSKIASICNNFQASFSGSFLEPLPLSVASVTNAGVPVGRISQSREGRRNIAALKEEEDSKAEEERASSEVQQATDRRSLLAAFGFDQPDPLKTCACGTGLFSSVAVSQHICPHLRAERAVQPIQRRPAVGDKRFPGTFDRTYLERAPEPANPTESMKEPDTEMSDESSSDETDFTGVAFSPPTLRSAAAPPVSRPELGCLTGCSGSDSESDGNYEPSDGESESGYSSEDSEMTDSDLQCEVATLESDPGLCREFPIYPRTEGFAVHPGDRKYPQLPPDVEAALVAWYDSRESPRAAATHRLLVAKYGAFMVWKLRLTEQRVKQWQSRHTTTIKAKQRAAVAAQVTEASASETAAELQSMTAPNLGSLTFPDLKLKFARLGGRDTDLEAAGGKKKAAYVKAVLLLIQRHSTLDVVEPGDTASKKRVAVTPPAEEAEVATQKRRRRKALVTVPPPALEIRPPAEDGR